MWLEWNILTSTQVLVVLSQKMYVGSVGMFWCLSPWMKSGWRGIYSLHTKSNRYTQLTKLGGTESRNSVWPIWFKMWMLGFSVGPTWSTRWDRCARVRVKRYLGWTDYTNSVGPIRVISKQRVGQANSVGPISYFGETEINAIGNREFASPSRWDRDPIGETKLIRVSGSGYVKWTRWRRIDQIGGAEFDYWFGTYVELRKWLRALDHITMHFEQASH